MILILKLSQFTPGIILKIETESPGGAVNTKISKQKYEETISLLKVFHQDNKGLLKIKKNS